MLVVSEKAGTSFWSTLSGLPNSPQSYNLCKDFIRVAEAESREKIPFLVLLSTHCLDWAEILSSVQSCTIS